MDGHCRLVGPFLKPRPSGEVARLVVTERVIKNKTTGIHSAVVLFLNYFKVAIILSIIARMSPILNLRSKAPLLK